MANTNIPGAPFVVRRGFGALRIKWNTPVTRGHGWNVYAGIEGTGSPIPGPPLNGGTPVPVQSYSLKLTDVPGNDPPGNDIEIALSSVNLTTGIESVQGPLSEVNVEAYDPCVPNIVLVGRAPDGTPMNLATDEDGRLFISDQGVSIPVEIVAPNPVPVEGTCGLVNHFQTDVSIDQTAKDILNAPAIVAPLANRHMIVLQNRGTQDAFLGTSGLQNHIMKPGGHRVLRGAEISLGMFARTASPVGSVINVWEFA